ncbi:hypothetical protein BDBG_16343 [Blastomyces gilchristii SLH14081]|uniref:Uncharacterized protein n=1 Tax=Blastomyces gilchristii (strain SLH14081) TaxID=559298 RepID=A0A179UE25_BLAGS|nr:uncharacterized protein BDBG_16343 [Blastomyces gilchristii SLH14081]OAT04772.1 hypothetical protein BDBG_16343 [Blastomyces gilchristii SLH14081]
MPSKKLSCSSRTLGADGLCCRLVMVDGWMVMGHPSLKYHYGTVLRNIRTCLYVMYVHVLNTGLRDKQRKIRENQPMVEADRDRPQIELFNSSTSSPE